MLVQLALVINVENKSTNLFKHGFTLLLLNSDNRIVSSIKLKNK